MDQEIEYYENGTVKKIVLSSSAQPAEPQPQTVLPYGLNVCAYQYGLGDGSYRKTWRT